MLSTSRLGAFAVPVFATLALVCSAGAPTAAVAEPSSATVEKAARANGKSEAEIRRILTDDTAKLDKKGRIYYVDPARRAFGLTATPAEKGPFPYSQTFLLHSRPGSNRVIYLDFNGHTITGTAWNDEFDTPSSFFAEPFSLDGTPASFSNAEQDVIQSVWQRVSEDYAPFGVDVTTQDPGAAAITRAGAADTAFGTRALITDATEISSTCDCGGVAYLGVFDDSAQHAYYQPALIFPEAVGDTAKNIAEVTSHEVGHNFDLNHDGTASVEYYAGHGSWAPIMGAGYERPIVQWSRGQYTGANNTQDDLATIAANGAPVLADDAGNTTATALDRGSGPSLSFAGLITTDADVDMFKITAGAGAASFSVNPAPNSPNLDTRLRLLNSAGTVIATANPPSGTSTADVATGMTASIAANLPSPGTYYLAVDGVGALNPASTGYSGYASIGRYTLSGTFPPSGGNNNFAAATTLTGSAGTINGSNVGATKEAGEPNHAGNVGGKSVWYRWTAPWSGTATIDTTGSAIDTLLGVYTGTAVNALTVKASNDNNGSSLQSRVTFAATAGTVYRIAIDGKGGAAGALKLNWSIPPVNNAFAAATPISGGAGTINGTNLAATKEAGEPNHAGNVGGKSVWYRWTAPATGPVTIDTIGSAFDTLLGVYTGTAVNALTQRASNDDGSGVRSKVTFTATAGTVYRIAVDGKAAASGAVTLHWSQTNDNFASARSLSGLSGTATATNVGATKETGEPNHAGDAGGKSIWFKWTAPKSGTVTVDTIGSAFDTLLGAYTGTAVNALTTRASNDDLGGGSLQSRVSFAVTGGTVYHFAVDGFGGASGAVTLHWSLP